MDDLYIESESSAQAVAPWPCPPAAPDSKGNGSRPAAARLGCVAPGPGPGGRPLTPGQSPPTAPCPGTGPAGTGPVSFGVTCRRSVDPNPKLNAANLPP